ncbi:hypothetical protein ACFOLF_37180 [Paenibacillus sepulcri]|uniref:Uncharacterized protein n=1 Tax=Paenibacillus sepulcri TaxID=359917 RepID=A0ABS7C9A8_9BACL|nr:hypothetical protein [Paenibacillus sepulcri]
MVKFYKLAADREKLNKQGYEAIKADIEKIKSFNRLADFAEAQKPDLKSSSGLDNERTIQMLIFGLVKSSTGLISNFVIKTWSITYIYG